MSNSFADPLLSSNDIALLWDSVKNDARNTQVNSYKRLNELGQLPTGKGVPYDAIRRLDVTEVAKLIRAYLKRNYAGFKFSVRTERFAGGTAIRIEYSKAFEEHRLPGEFYREMQGFGSNRFDGMTDSGSSITSWLSPGGVLSPAYCYAFGTVPEEDHPNPGGWQLVSSGAKFITAQRAY